VAGSEDDDLTPTEGIIMGNTANREVLAFLADDVVELKAHTKAISQIYTEIRALSVPVAIGLQAKLLEEYERHQAAGQENLERLKKVVIK